MILWRINGFNLSIIRPFFESLRELSIPGINPEKIKKIYFREMYDAHWFPEAILYADMRLTIDIIKIIGGTRKSKIV